MCHLWIIKRIGRFSGEIHCQETSKLNYCLHISDVNILTQDLVLMSFGFNDAWEVLDSGTFRHVDKGDAWEERLTQQKLLQLTVIQRMEKVGLQLTDSRYEMFNIYFKLKILLHLPPLAHFLLMDIAIY